MRLIDADTLIEKCGEWYTEEGSEEGYIGTLKQLLDKQPTIEPKQGKWIDKGDYAVCSNCGAHSGIQYDGVEPIPLKTNFCPNCGAQMKGADDGNK